MSMVDKLRALAAGWDREAERVRETASYQRGDARTREYEATLRHHSVQVRDIAGRPGQ